MPKRVVRDVSEADADTVIDQVKHRRAAVGETVDAETPLEVLLWLQRHPARPGFNLVDELADIGLLLDHLRPIPDRLEKVFLARGRAGGATLEALADAFGLAGASGVSHRIDRANLGAAGQPRRETLARAHRKQHRKQFSATARWVSAYQQPLRRAIIDLAAAAEHLVVDGDALVDLEDLAALAKTAALPLPGGREKKVEVVERLAGSMRQFTREARSDDPDTAALLADVAELVTSLP